RRAGRDRAAGRAALVKPVTFPCSGSVAEARARLEAAIDGRPWNAAGLDGWIRGDGVVLYYRDAAKYRAIFRPTFIGRFREHDGKTALDGRFRMTLFARALLPIWLAPAIVCLVVALVPTELQPQSPGFRIALALLGGLLAVMAFGRFAREPPRGLSVRSRRRRHLGHHRSAVDGAVPRGRSDHRDRLLAPRDRPPRIPRVRAVPAAIVPDRPDGMAPRGARRRCPGGA